MKLIFDGINLEQYDGECKSFKNLMQSEMNKLFHASGISLKGVEFPFELEESSGPIPSACKELSDPELDEEGSAVVINCGSEVEILAEAYQFGITRLIRGAVGGLYAALSTRSDIKEMYDGIKESFVEIGSHRDNLDQLLMEEFLFPDAKMSSRHFVVYRKEGSLYVADPGSMAGTWVDGEKLGSDEPCPNSDAFKKVGEYKVDSTVRLTGADGKVLYEEPLDRAQILARRAMNFGCAEVKDGSVITPGKGVFGDDYRFVLKTN